MSSDALFSSDSEHWLTPPEVRNPVLQMFGPPRLDPCGHLHSIMQPHRQIVLPSDGLSESWAEVIGNGYLWCNPPYGRALSRWAGRLGSYIRAGGEALILVPARVETEWWREGIAPRLWCALSSRLKFLETSLQWQEREEKRAREKGRPPRPVPPPVENGLVRTDSATFPSALIYAGPNEEIFLQMCSVHKLGDVWRKLG